MMHDAHKQSLGATRAWLGGVLLLGLFGSAFAGATDTQGCLAYPLHGLALPIPADATTQPVPFQGEAQDGATQLLITQGQLQENKNGPATLVSPSTVQVVTLEADNQGKKRFNITFNAQRKIGNSVVWPDDDVGVFEVKERLANGTTQALLALSGGAAVSFPTHGLIGIADLPETGFDGVGEPTDPAPNQQANTFLSIKGTPAASDNYYRAFDPNRELDNLDKWKARYGFPARGKAQDEHVTFYRNENDLGFGRQMHCRNTASCPMGNCAAAACYVSNFDDQDRAYAAFDADPPIAPIATVAMDFDIARPDRVRFYVFGPDGARANDAPLDGGGKKAVPNLCMDCHGGVLDPNGRVIGAHFLPFDVPTLPLPKDAPSQAAEFKAQNAIVRNIEANYGVKPSATSVDGLGNAITELIDGWYTKPDGTNTLADPSVTDFNAGFVPPGWNNDQPGGRKKLGGSPYLTVVAPYCRTCHVATWQTRPGIAWNAQGQFEASRLEIKRRVCDKSPTAGGNVPPAYVMPHAQRTYEKFWLSGARASLAVDLGLASCKFTSKL